MGELRFFSLGSFQASFDERPLGPFRTSKVQALLIYLVVEAASDPAILHRREALMELLWPGLPLKSAQDNLRQTLYQLSKTIPKQVTGDGQSPIQFVVSNCLSVGLNPDYRVDLDVAEFSQYLCQNQLEEAVALYRGDFLVDFYLPDSNDFEEWALAWRSKLRRQVLDALDTLAASYLKGELFGQVVDYAQQQLAIDDLRERAYRQLMEALARSGQRSAALAQYEICHRRLAEELGITPTEETKALYQRIEADQLPGHPLINLSIHHQAGHLVPRWDHLQSRVYLATLGPGDGTTRVEAAPPRQINRIRRFPLQDRPISPLARVRHGGDRQ